MSRAICDNDCAEMGWLEYTASNAWADLHLSVPPDADIAGRVWAFDHDEQTMMNIAGWLFSWELIED